MSLLNQFCNTNSDPNMYFNSNDKARFLQKMIDVTSECLEKYIFELKVNI